MFELNDDEKLRDQIERDLEAKILYQNGLKYAKEDGYDNGFDKGYNKGAKETKIAMVKNLLQNGNISIKTIANAANLEENEILKIQKNISFHL